jgi:hypothetical protein
MAHGMSSDSAGKPGATWRTVSLLRSPRFRATSVTSGTWDQRVAGAWNVTSVAELVRAACQPAYGLPRCICWALAGLAVYGLLGLALGLLLFICIDVALVCLRRKKRLENLLPSDIVHVGGAEELKFAFWQTATGLRELPWSGAWKTQSASNVALNSLLPPEFLWLFDSANQPLGDIRVDADMMTLGVLKERVLRSAQQIGLPHIDPRHFYLANADTGIELSADALVSSANDEKRGAIVVLLCLQALPLSVLIEPTPVSAAWQGVLNDRKRAELAAERAANRAAESTNDEDDDELPIPYPGADDSGSDQEAGEEGGGEVAAVEEEPCAGPFKATLEAQQEQRERERE